MTACAVLFFYVVKLFSKLAGAMGAAGGVDSDLALAEGADFGGGSGCGSRLLLLFADGLKLIDGADEQEDNGGKNEEVKDGGDE